MSNASDSSKKEADAPNPESEPELSEEQLEEVAGGGAVILERSLETSSTLSTSTDLGPQPHLMTPEPELKTT